MATIRCSAYRMPIRGYEDTEEYEEDEDEAVGSVDWKEHADTILEIVDDQLAAFGLEIVQYETPRRLLHVAYRKARYRKQSSGGNRVARR
jgi:hypothetical protein